MVSITQAQLTNTYTQMYTRNDERMMDLFRRNQLMTIICFQIEPIFNSILNNTNYIIVHRLYIYLLPFSYSPFTKILNMIKCTRHLNLQILLLSYRHLYIKQEE